MSWTKLAPNGAAELKLVDGKVYAQLKLDNMAWLHDKLPKPSLLQAQFLRLLHLRRQGGAETCFSSQLAAWSDLANNTIAG